MDLEEGDIKARIFYCFREKFYNSMLLTCKEAVRKFKGNSAFNLYHSLALMLNNRIEEGINDLDAVRSVNDMKLSVSIALMYANKLAGITNKSMYVKLDNDIRDFRKSAEALDFYYSAFVLSVFGKTEKALDYAEKALSMNSSMFDCAALKGWLIIQLKRNETRSLRSAIAIFKSIIQDNKHLDGTLGLVECYVYQNNHVQALELINKAVVKYTATSLSLVYKMKVMFSMQNWEQALEIMKRISNAEPSNIDVLHMNVLMLLVHDAAYEDAALCIKRLMENLDTIETGNCLLLMRMAQVFSRICGRNPLILKETHKMVNKAVLTNSNNADYIVEMGTQNLLSGNLEEALKYFKTATKLNESSVGALMGITYCEVLGNNNTDQLLKQVNFLLELEQTQNLPLMFYLKSKVATSGDDAIECLNKAWELHSESFKGYPYSELYLQLLDPDFLIEVAKSYMCYVSSSTHLSTNTAVKSSKDMETPLIILQTITKACPALEEAIFLLSKLQYLVGDTGSAVNNLNTIISKVEKASTDACLLMAQIHLNNGLFEKAAQSLEMSLSNDFQVRENPLYHFIDGVVSKHMNNLADAIKAFTTALNMVNSKEKRKNSKEKSSKISSSEKSQIYLELIDAYNAIGQTDEAARLVEIATAELKGTSEESRILILSADQYLQQKNIQAAINILQNVQPEESCYLKAKSKLAEILLTYRKDKYAYLGCYKEMVEKNPGPSSYLLLGDAYMVILEPDEALECYNNALQSNPKDPMLISKMGNALIETHYFSKAVAFYKDSIKLTDNSEAKLDLAQLYFQMKEYPKAEDLLLEALSSDTNEDTEDLTYLQYKTKLYNLLAKIQEKSGNIPEAISTLRNAKENQNRVYKRLLQESAASNEEVNTLVNINVKLAELMTSLKDQEQATNFYKDALEVTPDNINVLCALAKLYMQMGHLELCQKTCSNILKIDPENDAASVMMADIAFHKIDFDMALFHFTQLVLKQPANWNALSRLVEILRRTGNLENVPEHLKNAEDVTVNPSKDAGFVYCTGLYQWYSGNLNGALRKFNLARQDPQWGQMAIYNMIEICLNPNDEMFLDQVLDNEDAEYRDARSMALKTADRLLKELKQRIEANGNEVLRYKLLSNFRLIATKEKYHIEHAMEDLVSLASISAYKDHIGVILGISTAYTLLKQQQRAKNQLKRVVRTQWTYEDAEYLERCWLLLADYYIQSQKFENATELLMKVVNYNKSCSKAYEYLGLIAEKEQRYKEASNYYEQAWKLTGKSNPGIGFKLAYNCMKNKRYANAIDVAYEVLKINPEYPRVKKDILDKSLNNLRI